MWTLTCTWTWTRDPAARLLSLATYTVAESVNANLYAALVGVLCGFVAFIVLSFFVMIMLNVVDAVFLCYAMDKAGYGGPLISHPSFGPFIRSVHSVHSFGPFIWSIHSVHSFGTFIWSIHLVHSFGPFIGPIHLVQSLTQQV